ncbi:hypothetical protein Tco_0494272 [Tanacetum coccineum]
MIETSVMCLVTILSKYNFANLSKGEFSDKIHRDGIPLPLGYFGLDLVTPDEALKLTCHDLEHIFSAFKASICAASIYLGRSKLIVITKAQTSNGHLVLMLKSIPATKRLPCPGENECHKSNLLSNSTHGVGLSCQAPSVSRMFCRLLWSVNSDAIQVP